MTDRDDIRQPTDHLPPADERDPNQVPDEPSYPDSDTPGGGSPVSPVTAAEPEKPARHGVAKMPPGVG
jgi:hypothetical protein